MSRAETLNSSSQPADFRECSLNYEACGVTNTTQRIQASSVQRGSGTCWRRTALSLTHTNWKFLLALADGNADGKICYQDFVNL
ncbi:hypothetical protein INR49_029423, partial [Caranx melampygus]